MSKGGASPATSPPTRGVFIYAATHPESAANLWPFGVLAGIVLGFSIALVPISLRQQRGG